MREALITSAIESPCAPKNWAWPRQDHPVVQGLRRAGPDRRVPRTGRRCDYPLHLGLTEAGMGSKGIVASTAALSVLLQEGIGDTIRISLTPEPGGDRTGSGGGAGNPADHGPAQIHPDGDRLPGLRPHRLDHFPGTGRQHPDLPARADAGMEKNLSGRGSHERGRDGLHRQRSGESKHANIGISLPGTGESPAAPVFVDGAKVATLRGERIVEEFRISS
jgi:(E)-4-hydroxy-3-methylbut-2-enyl-diphosphate synthase